MTDPVTTGCVLLGIGAAHLGYTYFGYPWIVSLLPTRRARRAVDRTPERVSIVIAARDPGTAVAEKVSELLLSKTVACEIVVVLDGRDPAAAAALAELADDRIKVRVLERAVGKAVALNVAVAMTEGDVLVFTDVRQRIARGAIESLVAELASPDVGIVSGSLTIPSTEGSDDLYRRYWRFERWLRMREAAWDSSVGVSGALYALKRDLWSPLPPGLFGCRFRSCARASAWDSPHAPSPSTSDQGPMRPRSLARCARSRGTIS